MTTTSGTVLLSRCLTVQRQEVGVRPGHDLAGAGGVEFGGELPFVLDPAPVGE